MLTDSIKRLSLNLVTDRLGAIMELVKLKIEPNKSHSEFMLTIRNIGGRLDKMTIDKILPIFALTNKDQDRFPRLVARYLQGDASLLKATVYSLEVEMNDEFERQQTLCSSTHSASNGPSIRRVTEKSANRHSS